MNSDPSPDDALELLLRRAAPPAVADDGFSTRVLSALPAPATPSRRLRMGLMVWSGVVGVALATAVIVANGGFAGIPGAIVARFGPHEPALDAISAAGAQALIVAAVVTIISLCYAFRPRTARRRAFLF